jgi:hypothetical protein
MTQDHDLTTGHRAPYREWAPTQPPEPAAQGAPAARPVRGGPWIAAAPMLVALGLTVAAALAVGTTARATAALTQPKAMPLAGAEQVQRQVLAVQAFRAREYATAYGRFAELADAGDAPSALMALAMLRHGPTLFGSDWSITPDQVHRWSAIALREVQDHGLAIAQHDRGE